MSSSERKTRRRVTRLLTICIARFRARPHGYNFWSTQDAYKAHTSAPSDTGIGHAPSVRAK
jgi:hypothetical protein